MIFDLINEKPYIPKLVIAVFGIFAGIWSGYTIASISNYRQIKKTEAILRTHRIYQTVNEICSVLLIDPNRIIIHSIPTDDKDQRIHSIYNSWNDTLIIMMSLSFLVDKEENIFKRTEYIDAESNRVFSLNINDVELISLKIPDSKILTESHRKIITEIFDVYETSYSSYYKFGLAYQLAIFKTRWPLDVKKIGQVIGWGHQFTYEADEIAASIYPEHKITFIRYQLNIVLLLMLLEGHSEKEINDRLENYGSTFFLPSHKNRLLKSNYNYFIQSKVYFKFAANQYA